MGRRLGERYALEQVLGHGGMSTVYRARDLATDQDLAVKILKPELRRSFEFTRFKREFRAAQRLSHPNCVKSYEMEDTPEGCYFTMEYLPGGSLFGIKAALRPKTAVGVALQVLAGLDYVHAEAIVHRDIKPQNILFDRPLLDEDPLRLPTVKLSDFGIAKVKDLRFEGESVGDIHGSIRYFAPEYLREGIVDPRIDLYAFGLVFYQLLAGRHPLSETGARTTADDWLRLHMSFEPPSLDQLVPGIPKIVSDVIARLMEKDPDRRYRTAAQAYADLMRWFSTDARDLALPEIPPLTGSPYLAAPGFAGRERELAAIRSAFRANLDVAPSASTRKAPMLVLIRGPAGVGKTRLLDRAIRQSKGRHFLLVGQGRPEPGLMHTAMRSILSRLSVADKKVRSVSAKTVSVGHVESTVRISDARPPTPIQEPMSTIQAAPTVRAVLPVRAPGAPENPAEPGTRGEPGTSAEPGSAGALGGARVLGDAGALGGAASLVPAAASTDRLTSSGHPVDTATRTSDIAPGPQLRDREAARLQYLVESTDMLIRVAAQRACCVVLEDAQWADAATLELLEFWVRGVATARLQNPNRDSKDVKALFVLTTRPEGTESLATLIEFARQHDILLDLELDVLSTADTEAIVMSMLMESRCEAVHGFVERVFGGRETTPLLVAQVMHILFSRGLLNSRQGIWDGVWDLETWRRSDVQLPSTIQEAIGDRASRLSVDTQRALAAASVIGRRFEMALISDVVELHAAELLDAMDEASVAGFVTEDQQEADCFLFTHERFRESIYRHLPAEERMRLHRGVGRAIIRHRGATHDEAPALAYHFGAGASHKKAYRYGIMAANGAMKSHSFDRASRLFEAAIASAKEAGIPVERWVIERFGDACATSGRLDEAQACYRVILTHDLPESKRVRVLRKEAELEYRRAKISSAVTPLEGLLSRLGFRAPRTQLSLRLRTAISVVHLAILGNFPCLFREEPRRGSAIEDVLCQACALMAEVSYYLGFQRASFYALQSAIIAARIGPARSSAYAFCTAGYALAVRGRYRMSRTFASRALRYSVDLAPQDHSFVYLLVGLSELAEGHVDVALAHFRRACDVLASSADPLRLALARSAVTVTLSASGRPIEGEDVAQVMVDEGALYGFGMMEHLGRSGIVTSLLTRGHFDEAIARAERLIPALDVLGDRMFLNQNRLRLALALAFSGRAREGLPIAIEATEDWVQRRFASPSMSAIGFCFAVFALSCKQSGWPPGDVSDRVRSLRAKMPRSTNRATEGFRLAALALFEDLERGSGSRPAHLLTRLDDAVARSERYGFWADVGFICRLASLALEEGSEAQIAYEARYRHVLDRFAHHPQPQA